MPVAPVAPATATEASGFRMRCGPCGEWSALESWAETPVFGFLPWSDYQCPKCAAAFRKNACPEGGEQDSEWFEERGDWVEGYRRSDGTFIERVERIASRL